MSTEQLTPNQPAPNQPAPTQPMPNQPAPTQPTSDQGKQHVHHSYIWLGSLRAMGILLVVIIIGNIASLASLVEALGEGSVVGAFGIAAMLGIGILVILVAFGLFAGFTALAYKHLFYEIGPNEFSLYSGILSKKKVHVPYQRIQSVDQNASLLQRLFGVCNVSIDTAGGSANSAILVPYLTKQQAQTLRSELYAHKISLQADQMSQTSQIGQPTQTDTTSQAASVAPNTTTVATPQAAVAQTSTSQAAVAQATVVQAATPQAATIPQPGAQIPGQAAGQTGNVLDIGEHVWNEIGGVFAGEATFAEPVSYEYGLSNKELILTGFSNNSSFFLAVVIAFVFILQALSFVFDLVPDVGDMTVDTLAASALSYGIMQVSLVAVGGLIVIAVIVWLVSTLNACLQFGGFHARRRGERIEVERGLLQHQSQSVSIDRVQSVIIKQTFIRRLLGYCEISLGKIDATVETNNSEQAAAAHQGLIIHPFVKKSRVEEILAGIIPEYADIPTELTPVSKKALRRGLIRRCILQGGGFWLAVFVALCQIIIGIAEPYVSLEDALFFASISPFFVIAYALAVVIFVIDIVGTIFWARESGFAFNKRFMTVKNGGLSISSVSFPRNKIQFGFTRTNPFQRRARTATVCAVTAAGIGGTTTCLIDAQDSDASAWLTWLEPRKQA